MSKTAHCVHAEWLQELTDAHITEVWKILLFDIVVKKAGPSRRREVHFHLIVRKFGHFAVHGKARSPEARSILCTSNGIDVFLALVVIPGVELKESGDPMCGKLPCFLEIGGLTSRELLFDVA